MSNERCCPDHRGTGPIGARCSVIIFDGCEPCCASCVDYVNDEEDEDE